VLTKGSSGCDDMDTLSTTADDDASAEGDRTRSLRLHEDDKSARQAEFCEVQAMVRRGVELPGRGEHGGGWRRTRAGWRKKRGSQNHGAVSGGDRSFHTTPHGSSQRHWESPSRARSEKLIARGEAGMYG
jgi:hypothetical protein